MINQDTPSTTLDHSSTSPARPSVLAIEIASKSTAAYDRGRKKDVYAAFGIPSYRVVDPDPDRPAITVYTLAGRKYRQTAVAVGDQQFVVEQPFTLQIQPPALVAGPWQR